MENLIEQPTKYTIAELFADYEKAVETANEIANGSGELNYYDHVAAALWRDEFELMQQPPTRWKWADED